uniref:TIMELESS-interacting protein n=1 Tax=Steinernema glaseri TaxID=37863 RepID=A0A1I8A0A9_9BILA
MIVTASAATLPSSAPIGIMERPPTIDPKNTVMPKYTAEEAEAKLKPEEEDDSFLDAYLQNDEKRPPKKKMILKPKRYRTKMIGSYRNVPCVDNMCKMFEDSDFDKTDLFPLGVFLWVTVVAQMRSRALG